MGLFLRRCRTAPGGRRSLRHRGGARRERGARRGAGHLGGAVGTSHRPETVGKGRLGDSTERERAS